MNQSDDHLGGVGEKASEPGEVAVDPLPAAALGLAVAPRGRQRLGVHHLPRRHPPQLRLKGAQQPGHHRLPAPLRRALLLLLHRVEAEAEHLAMPDPEPADAAVAGVSPHGGAEARHGRRLGERRRAEPREQLMRGVLLAPVLDASFPHG